MNKEKMQEPVLSSPVLPRLDRLDRLLQFLEEKHSLSSARHSSNPVAQKAINQEDDHECKTLSSALEEVQHKGTLMERLTMLENRVLQLSLEMDEGNTSKSSSPTIPSTEKLDRGFTSTTGSGRKDDQMDENEIINEVIMTTLPGSTKSSAAVVIEKDSNIACDAEKIVSKNRRRLRKKGQKNWMGWFHLGCN